MDDLDDGPVLGDFTLDYFLTQLLRYLEGKRDELEKMPIGAYAVTETGSDLHPVVIFFLRQRNASDDRRQRPPSPAHPYYLVYILDDGSIRFGCGNAQRILSAFDAATMGKSSPITELCDRFDSETCQGNDMNHYDKLLNDVIAHIRQSRASGQISQLRMGSGARDFILPATSESPDQPGDFELATWLIITDN